MRSVRFSLRSRRSSSRSSVVSPAVSPASIFDWFTHDRSDSSEMPRSSDAALRLRPDSR
jgi:hypothetical protein